MMRRLVIVLVVAAQLGVPSLGLAGETRRDGSVTVWSASAEDLNPPVDSKQATRRDIIAGQIYASFISKADINIFLGGGYKLGGKDLMDKCIEAADALMLRLDNKWPDQQFQKK